MDRERNRERRSERDRGSEKERDIERKREMERQSVGLIHQDLSLAVGLHIHVPQTKPATISNNPVERTLAWRT